MTYRLTTLPNGLRVGSELLPHAKSVAVAVSVGVGSRHERKHEKGLSHLVEHMMYKGTRTRSARDIARAFDAIGAECNAYTSADSTVYYARTLPEYAPRLVEVLCDIIQNSVFDARELKQEKDAVIEEILGSRDDPQQAVSDHFCARAFPRQPLGECIFGTQASVRSFTRRDIRRFRNRHYHPGNMVVSAAGNASHAKLLRWVRQYFESPAAAPRRRARNCDRADYRGGDRRTHWPLQQTHILLGLPTVSPRSGQYTALMVYAHILGGSMSSRLFQEVREKRGLAYEVEASITPYAEMGMLEVYSAASPKKTRDLSRVLCEQIAAMADGVGDDELARAKTQLRAQLLMEKESPEDVAEAIGTQLLEFGRYEGEQKTLERIEAVTAADIRRLAGQIAAGKPTLATLGAVDKVISYKTIKGILRKPRLRQGKGIF